MKHVRGAIVRYGVSKRPSVNASDEGEKSLKNIPSHLKGVQSKIKDQVLFFVFIYRFLLTFHTLPFTPFPFFLFK
jgi:hypothetical protein